MPSSELLICIEQVERVKFRLGKHFARKVPVIEQGRKMRIDFPIGQCFIEECDRALHFACSAADQERLGAMQDIITSHLCLMARYPIRPLDWRVMDDGLSGTKLPDPGIET